MAKRRGIRSIVLVWGSLSFAVVLQAQEGSVAVDSDRWTMIDAEVVEYLGRRCLSGTAVLEDVDFQDGVIEVTCP